MTLSEFEKFGVEYLYNLDPATGNLFFLNDIQSGVVSSFEDATPSNLAQVLRFRIKSVKLDNTMGVEFDTSKAILPGNPIFVSGIKESHNVTIEWVEDSFFRIQKFHQKWLSNWVSNKVLIDGDKDKFYSFQFKVFRLVNKEKESFSPSLKMELAYTITLVGAAPTDLSDFSFSYDEQDNGKSFVGKYVVKEVKIESPIDTDVQNELTMAGEVLEVNGETDIDTYIS